LDLETQSKHTLFLVKGGIRGLVILGTTGEAVHITSKERNELIKSQRKTLDDAGYKDTPIIAGTATQNIEDTLQQIAESKEAGAESVLVLSPGYFATAVNQTGIQKWFEAVADKSVLPIMICMSSSNITGDKCPPDLTNSQITTPALRTTCTSHRRRSRSSQLTPTSWAPSFRTVSSTTRL
jgi:dihydrodipicolinate synthase/N-acetylneuraminate lyase